MDESFEVSTVDKSIVDANMNVCNVCLYKTKYKSNFTRHMKLHSDAVTPLHNETLTFHVCCHCGKMYKTKYGLTLHERSMHENNFRFTCDVCKKGFNMLSAYNGHLTTHEKVLKNKRKRCKKSSCQKHMQTAHFTKQFTCKEDGCGAAFSSKKTLIEHRLGKHQSRMYTCSKCNKLFKWRSSVHAHQRYCQK